MKKLLVSLAVTTVVAAVNAASVTWSLTNITAPGTTTALTTGTVAYFMDAKTYETFTGLNASAMVSYAKNNATYTAKTANYKNTTRVIQESGDYGKGESISGYIVLLDVDADNATKANYIAYTTYDSATIAESGANALISFGKFADAMAASGSSGGWVAVPEPTSGLLMLLGMAGLALKRKHI